jgi:hypothetical protein
VEWIQHDGGFVSFLLDVISKNIELSFSQKFPLFSMPDFMSWREHVKAYFYLADLAIGNDVPVESTPLLRGRRGEF